MKKILLSLAAVGLSAVAAPAAHASDGTITFMGRLVDQTCTIKVNGVAGPTQTVILPAVSINLLQAATNTAGQTGFTIGLEGCTVVSGLAHAFFESGPGVDPLSGNLIQMETTGAATNIQLQLLDALSGQPIKAGDSGQSLDTTPVTIDAAGTATLPYAVQYYATGPTTPGFVTGQVTYSIFYE
ncbi:MAG: type 1 fimbrial protein [Betaproteobacteria bacterium]|nr:type 1 fimbrial protein [Betaproteobacteria bacterium]